MGDLHKYPTPWHETVGGEIHDADGFVVISKQGFMQQQALPFIVRAANNFDKFIVACQSAVDEIEGGRHDKAVQTLKAILEGAGEQTLPKV